MTCREVELKQQRLPSLTHCADRESNPAVPDVYLCLSPAHVQGLVSEMDFTELGVTTKTRGCETLNCATQSFSCSDSFRAFRIWVNNWFCSELKLAQVMLVHRDPRSLNLFNGAQII